MYSFLIATDFSPTATNAMNYGLDLAAREEAVILLLHVKSRQFFQKNKAEAEKSPEELLESLRTQIVEEKKLRCQHLLRFGAPETEILGVMDEKKPDLTILGMKGTGKGMQRMMGSTAKNIIEKANSPVMVIPENCSFKEISSITYATDFHESDLKALHRLTEMAAPLQATITLLHICKKADEECRLQLENFKKRAEEYTTYKLFSCQLAEAGNVTKELDSYTRQGATDMLVMSTHQRNLIDKIFGRSITRKISAHSSIPLLAFHYRQKPLFFIFGMALEK